MREENLNINDEVADFCTTLMSHEGGGIVDASGFVALPEIQAWAVAAANGLKEAGLNPHEPVIVPITGVAEDVAGILAVISAGGVAVPIHAKAHKTAFDQIVHQTGARLCLRYLSTPSVRAKPDIEVFPRAAPPERPLLSDAAMITFTSGSTGHPKGVVLSLARMSAKLSSLQEKLQMREGAVSAVPLHLNFSFGQWVTFLTLLRGGTVIMSDRFDASAIAKMIAKGRLNYLAAVPTMLRMLLDNPGSSSNLTILSGGEAVNSELRGRIFTSWPGADIYSIYGLTESGTCDLFHHDALGFNTTDTLGYPAPDVELQTDPATSELLIKTPFSMLGYLDMPDDTAATLNNGWLRTGDMGEILPDGEVRYTGRLKELINRAGNKVSPFEIETLFLQHPSVSDVLATGAHDTRLGEAIHLLVIPQVGENPQPDALLSWAKGRIDRFKLPDYIHLSDALPVGPTGKADRKSLRARIEQDLIS